MCRDHRRKRLAGRRPFRLPSPQRSASAAIPITQTLDHLKPGQRVANDDKLSDDRVKHWQFACTSGTLGGVLPPGSIFEIAETNLAHHWVRLLIPGTYPTRHLQVAADELSDLFSLR